MIVDWGLVLITNTTGYTIIYYSGDKVKNEYDLLNKTKTAKETSGIVTSNENSN